MWLYFIIFFSKALETSLGTLRMILVADGKKILGAILQGIISLIWIFITGIVIIDIKKDPFKVVVFAVGCTVGSYLGSYLEEKLALGDNMLMAIIDKEKGKSITDTIRGNGFGVTSMEARGKDNDKNVLMIMVARKKRHHIINIIKKIDDGSMIVSENASTLEGGYNKKSIDS